MKTLLISAFCMLVHAVAFGQSDKASLPDAEKESNKKLRFELNGAMHLPAFTSEIRKRKLGLGIGAAIVYDTRFAIKPLLGIDLNSTRYVGHGTLDTNTMMLTIPLKTSITHLGIPLGIRYVGKKENAVFFDFGLMTDIVLSYQTEASIGVYQSDNFQNKDISPNITKPFYFGFYAGIGMNKCMGRGLIFAKLEMRHSDSSSNDRTTNYIGYNRIVVGYKW